MERRKQLFLQKILLLAASLAVLIGLLAAATAFQKVEFADAGLEAAVRDKLGNRRAPIARTDLLHITHLDASGRDINRLEGIENLRQLVVLDLSDNRILDLSPLRTLYKLRELNLDNTSLFRPSAANLEDLSGLPLRILSMNNNWFYHGGLQRISDVSLFGRFTSLEELALADNHIEDISPLSALENLRRLDLRGNQVTGIGPLAGMPALEELNLRDNDITDLEALSGLGNLAYLNLHSNPEIRSIAPLESLTGLETLILRNVPVGEDIRALRNMTRLQRLNISNCGLEDLAALEDLTKLVYLDINLNSKVNSIKPLAALIRLETLRMRSVPVENDIQVLMNMVRLRRLDLRNCGIEEISFLRVLKNLRRLDLRNNQISEITVLSGLPQLEELNLRENDISCISALADLRKLRYLNIHSNSQIKTIKPISELVNLETLILRNVPVGEEIKALQNMTKLRRLNIRNCGIANILVIANIMEKGALQDDQENNIRAAVNIRDNLLPVGDEDPYFPIRRYWNNITERSPKVLPFAKSPVDEPIFSRMGGFYAEEFMLELITSEPEGVIYYTLDGSIPHPDNVHPDPDMPIENRAVTYVYEKPIAIDGLENKNNDITRIPTNRMRRGDRVWIEPRGETFKAVVVRAIVEKQGILSNIVTHSFFIDNKLHNRYSFPVISISTYNSYLFDDDIGIYVYGNNTNYNRRGYNWEIPIHIEFFEKDGNLAFSHNAGARIHGSFTRRFPQKSLRLYSRKEYGPEYFAYQFFNDKAVDKFKTIILRNSGNDWNLTMFRDAAMQSLIQHLNLDTQYSRPTIVFINGHYWGIHNVRDRYDEYYLSYHYNVDQSDVVILDRAGSLHTGREGEEAHYHNMLSFIRENGLVSKNNYEYIQTQMDVDNFIKYYATQIYNANTDWPHANIRYWRYTGDEYSSESPPELDGRWRWLVFDVDRSLGYRGKREIDHNTIHWVVTSERNARHSFLFRSLLHNESFRNDFLNVFADLLNTTFHPARVINTIGKFENIYSPEITEHIARWGGPRSYENWQRNIDVMREFAGRRPDIVREHIVENFNLSGTANVTLIADQERGYITINSLMITDDTPGIENSALWSGSYFAGIPIQITAVPLEGYRFEGWKEIQDEEAMLTKVLERDITLTAVFSEIP